MENDFNQTNQITLSDLQKLELIKICTSGSVDDGKSTMIGRLLYDCQAIYDDQLAAIKKTSEKSGFAEIDFSLLLDGLTAEREQKITIDVAYRYFTSRKRRYIFADVPGHEQYTKNMITGASLADVAMILVDARKGMLIQSKRHLFINSFLRVPHILIVINKMDLVDYRQDIYEKIKNDFIEFSSKLNIGDLQFIPISAVNGDSLVYHHGHMPWYQGRTLLDYLENINLSSNEQKIDFRFPVQSVIRPHQDFRGYAGRIESGHIKIGEKITILPSRQETEIESIIYNDRCCELAKTGQSIILTLKDNIDVSRGEMMVRSNNLPEIGNQFEAIIAWLDDVPLNLNKSYLLKQTTRITRAQITNLKYRLNIDNLHRENCQTLNINEIGKVIVNTNLPLFFDAFSKNTNTGSFILIDETNNQTVAAGIILNKTQGIDVKNTTKKIQHQGAVLWLTGLPGSGKSTIADKLAAKLQTFGIKYERLDGDEVRKSLTKDLGFSREDRNKNIERVSFVAKLLSKHGIMVIASFISPYQQHRDLVRKETTNFIEIFIDTPLAECIRRDVKGHYRNALDKQLTQFTGVDDVYENPQNPELRILTTDRTPETNVQEIFDYLLKNNLITL